MASFNNFYVVVTFFICFNFLMISSFGSETLQPPTQGPSNEINYAPRPLTSYDKYLINCSKKLTHNCGQQVYFSVFVGNQTLSNNCCLGLVKDAGKSCHMDITNNAVKLPMFKKNRTEILSRSLKVWNGCTLVHTA